MSKKGSGARTLFVSGTEGNPTFSSSFCSNPCGSLLTNFACNIVSYDNIVSNTNALDS